MNALVAVGAARRIAPFNDAAEKIVDWTASEAIGRWLAIFIPERFRPSYFPTFEISAAASAGPGAVSFRWRSVWIR